MKREIRYGMLPLVVWMLSVTACTEEEHFAPDKQDSYTEELTFGADELEGWEDMTQTRAESSLLSHKRIEYKEKQPYLGCFFNSNKLLYGIIISKQSVYKSDSPYLRISPHTLS